LEQAKLCFKIWVKDEARQRELREFWHHRLVGEGGKHGLDVVKPGRFGKGQCMTVAVLNGEYRKTADNGKLDASTTVAVLRRAEKLLESCGE
jgi:hypothetical protein